jgi:hypothetical protein
MLWLVMLGSFRRNRDEGRGTREVKTNKNGDRIYSVPVLVLDLGFRVPRPAQRVPGFQHPHPQL